jgi:hypothetical protein
MNGVFLSDPDFPLRGYSQYAIRDVNLPPPPRPLSSGTDTTREKSIDQRSDRKVFF